MRRSTLAVSVLVLVGTIVGGVGASRAAGSSSVTRHAEPFDFNGDGFADLAIGAPFEGSGPPAYDEPGVVNVLYGSVSGVSAFADQQWNQDSHGVLGTSGRYDHFGAAVASEDFDGDGFADLAVGSPLDEEGEAQGSVNVLYGSPVGLRRLRNQLWIRDDLRQGPFAGPEDAFGSVLAAGDLDGDGYADLAIGAPCAIVLSKECGGTVHVVYGSDAGLTKVGNQYWTRESAGVKGEVDEEGDAFGSSLAIGNFGEGPEDDLAIGAPFAPKGGNNDGGSVNVLYGSPDGVTPRGDQLWSQDSPGIEDETEPGDDFGFSLAAGHLGNDPLWFAERYEDLAIGVPAESVGGVLSAGAVNVLYGSAEGLTSAGDQLWTQDSPGVEDEAEPGDYLGFALAIGDLGGPGLIGDGDLVIGVPFEEGSTATDGGAVNVLYSAGASSGLWANDDQLWNQDSIGIEDRAEPLDWFGTSLAIADFGLGNAADLVVGVPREGVHGVRQAGGVNVIYGSRLKLLHPAGNQFWSQGSAGVLDDAETGDRFAVVGGTSS